MKNLPGIFRAVLCACALLILVAGSAAQNCVDVKGTGTATDPLYIVQQNPNCGVYANLPGQPPPQPAGTALSESDMKSLGSALVEATGGNETAAASAVADLAIAAITIGYPPAGAVLGIAKGLILSGASAPDPVGEAIKAINNKINEIQGDLNHLENEIRGVRTDLYLDENYNRQRAINNYEKSANDAYLLLKDTPTTLGKPLDTMVYDSEWASQQFIDDSDVWTWRDWHFLNGQQVDPLPKSFKTFPAFTVYSHALVTWMAVLEYVHRDNPKEITTNKDLVRKLLRHAAFLSVEPTFHEYDTTDSHTLPENLMRTIRCQGDCANYTCEDLQRHVILKAVDIPSQAGRDDKCIMLPHKPFTPTPKQIAEVQTRPLFGSAALARWLEWDNAPRIPDQFEFQCQNGLEAMTLLADRLVKLATTGSSQLGITQFSGRFANKYITPETLYAVKPNGELLLFHDVTTVDKDPPNAGSGDYWTTVSTPCGTSITLDQPRVNRVQVQANAGKVLRESEQSSRVQVQGNAGKVLRESQASNPNPRVTTRGGAIQSAALRENGTPAPIVTHKLDGPRLVGSGWQNFRQVIPAGGGSFYGVTADGTLMWYRHDGANDGTAKWTGPIRIASGWNVFKQIIAGGEGVLYGVGADGSLQWYRHTDYQDATHPTGTPAAPSTSTNRTRPSTIFRPSILPVQSVQGPRRVGTGWGNFVQVFSTGEGVIYGITADGRLMWYRHTGYLTGTPQWQGPKQVGSGWANMKRVVSPENGVIYAMPASGELLWYQHDGWADGTPKWQGPTKIAADWSNFSTVFTLMKNPTVPGSNVH